MKGHFDPQDEHYANKIVYLLESLRTHFTLAPSDCKWYVAGLRMALRVREFYPDFLSFIDWWGLEHLQPEDFQPYTPEGGRPIMPLAERTYLAVGKALLEQDPKDPQKIQSFLSKLQNVSQQHPQFLWLNYIESKILLSLGQTEEALPKLRLFLADKPREWWAWSALAFCAGKLNDLKAETACYCRSISFQKDEAFLVKVREKLAMALHRQQKTAEACQEAFLATSTRMKLWGNIPPSLQQLRESLDCPPDIGQHSNQSLYKTMQPVAMAFAVKHFPVLDGVFHHVVSGKLPGEKRLLIQSGKETIRTYPTWLAPMPISPGDYVRLTQHPAHPNKICLVSPMPDRPTLPFVKTVTAPLKIHPKGFGFVQDIFVPPPLIPKDLTNRPEVVTVTAAWTWNKKKEEWGWKSLSLSPGSG